MTPPQPDPTKDNERGGDQTTGALSPRTVGEGANICAGARDFDSQDAPQPAPDGLGPRGGEFWGALVGEFEFTAAERAVLTEVCRTLDLIDSLQAQVAADGVAVEGSRGQVRTHPALMELRGHRAEFRHLIDRLNLPDDDGVDMATGAQVKARNAANKRWSNVTAMKRDADGA